jgi:hypothetical protein
MFTSKMLEMYDTDIIYDVMVYQKVSSIKTQDLTPTGFFASAIPRFQCLPTKCWKCRNEHRTRMYREIQKSCLLIYLTARLGCPNNQALKHTEALDGDAR